MEYVCNLLQRLEGLNQNKLSQYQASVIENNISGMVLLNCELSELKPVMQMSFGDWELFKALVQTLREREVSSFAASMKPYDGLSSNGDPAEVRESPNIQFMQSINTLDPKLEVPSPHYAPGSPKENKENITTMANKSLSTRYATERDSQASTQSTKVKTARSQGVPQQDRGSYEDTVDFSRSPGKMTRNDSFVHEVMMEGAVLKGVIAATGVQTDSDEADTPPSPIPEEEMPAKLTKKAKHDMRDKQKKAQWEARQCKLDRERSQERDRAISIREDDDDDSDAEEIERLSRKSSISNLSSSSYSVRRAPQQTAVYVNEVKNPSRQPVSNASSRESLYHTPLKQTSINYDDSVESGENAPLVQPKQKSKSGLKLDVLRKTSKSKESLTEEKSSDSTPTTCRMMSRDSGGAQSGTTSVASSTQDIPSLSDQEQEFIALRKLAQASDVSGPSAFKPVTPGSSRASSRASSLALSGTLRPISREDSSEAIRLHINDSFDTKSVGHSPRQHTPTEDLGDELSTVYVDQHGRTVKNSDEKQRLL